jgi:hypothetical protein
MTRAVARIVDRPGAGLPPFRWRVVLPALPFAGGAGLVIYVLAGVSLPFAAAAVALLGGATWLAVMTAASEEQRHAVAARVKVGLRAGIVATASYDLARYGIVALFTLSFEPFHVWPIFGRLFVGQDASAGVALAAGIGYHAANGIGFAIGYALLFRRPGPLTGVAWGVGLELCMAFLYPSWLRIAALQEFLAVSALGHVVYGGVLGLAVRWQLDRSRDQGRPVGLG